MIQYFFNSRIHPEVLPHSADILSQDFNGDVTSLKAMFQSRPVVASTCLGINHPSIAGRTFDYCIFDEAGQALLLATLGPLFHCDKFVLVGDPQQLPPVVQVKENFSFNYFIRLEMFYYKFELTEIQLSEVLHLINQEEIKISSDTRSGGFSSQK